MKNSTTSVEHSAAKRDGSRWGRLVTAVVVVLSAPAVAASSLSEAASGGIVADARISGFAPPPTATTTTTTSPVLAQPTTSTTTVPAVIAQPTTTTTTMPAVIAQPTTTRQPAPVTSTTATPVTVPLAAPSTAVPSTAVPGNLAVTTTAPGLPDELIAGATVTPTSGEPLALGTLSTDPDDWSDEVRQYLQADGLDLEALASQNAGPAGTPGQLLSNEGCAVNCITSGLAWAVGVGAHLEVTTSVPAFIQIEILDVGLKFGPPSAKTWGATWPHLEPNTTYQAVARAHDAQGNMAVASGEFTTASRYARVTFEPTVFWFGNLASFDPWGDYLWTNHASAYLNGAEVASATDMPHPTLSFDTGAIDPSVIEVAYVGVYDCVLGCEDVSFWDLFKAAIFGPDPQQAVPPMVEHGTGVTPTAFWGTVANGIQLDGYPDNVTSWTGHEFTFPLSTFWGDDVGPPVYLTIDVTVEVWYHLQ